jgi:hypothetical protein
MAYRSSNGLNPDASDTEQEPKEPKLQDHHTLIV